MDDMTMIIDRLLLDKVTAQAKAFAANVNFRITA